MPLQVNRLCEKMLFQLLVFSYSGPECSQFPIFSIIEKMELFEIDNDLVEDSIDANNDETFGVDVGDTFDDLEKFSKQVCLTHD